VPYARGLEKHLPVEQIVHQAKHHIAHGAEEITLLGQIVNKHPHFVQICKEILAIPGLRRLRYTSPYPNFFGDELLALHEHEEKMCPHIHMPLQAGSDSMLKKMFRGYTVEQYKTFVDRIRSLKRPISITSDVVIGFCGETDEDRKGTMDVCEYANFDMIYMGIYSPRPGTYAARHYTDDIPKTLKHQRRTQLNELLKRMSTHNNLSEI
jgi:tRNA-2-methylthio-N6-dimethylallyladenosine synthase